MKRTWMLAIAMVISACGSPQTRQDDEPQLLGTPPKPSEDPFFYVARPPVEAAAESTGTIGDVKQPEKKSTKPAEKRSSEPDPKLLEELTKERAARQAVEADLALARSEREKLSAENEQLRKQVESKASVTVAGESCHSCVRICPDKGGCPKDAELVCGWGSGKSQSDAKKRATAECNGALEGMRKSGAYSRLAGQCPVATCR